MKKRVALLGTTVVALALVAALSFAWFTSSTGPINADFSTAKIKVELVDEGIQTDSANKLPGEEIKVEGIQIKNSSTRNSVAKVSFSEAAVVAQTDYNSFTTGVDVDGYNDVYQTWTPSLDDLANDLSELAWRAGDPNYDPYWQTTGGIAYIDSAQGFHLSGIFSDARSGNNLPISQEILDFLTIAKDNNLRVGGDREYSFNENPYLVAYQEYATTITADLSPLLQVSLLSNFDDVAAANNLLYKEIDGSYYVALTTPTPDDEIITFDLGFRIPTSWGNEYQNMTITGVGVTVEAVQCTKEAVKDVYGLSATEVAQLESEFSSLSDFWTD
jgi:hypothetical protein